MGSRRSAKTLVLFPSFVPAAAGGLPLGGAGAKRLMRESPPQRAILHVSADSPFAFASLLPCHVASGGPLSLPPKKEAKETARGDLFRGGPLWTPSPTTKGAAAPIGFPGVYGGRRTGDWTGDTDCHSRRGHRLRNDGDGGSPAAAGLTSWALRAGSPFRGAFLFRCGGSGICGKIAVVFPGKREYNLGNTV